MKLKPKEKFWVPLEYPLLFSLLGPGEKPPVDREDFLGCHGRMLDRLLLEASQEEIRNADHFLREYMSMDARLELDWQDLWTPMRVARLLHLESAEIPWYDVQNLAMRVLPHDGPVKSKQESREEAQELDLRSYLGIFFTS